MSDKVMWLPGGKENVLRVYVDLNKHKLFGEHWAWVAISRIAAGEPEAEVMADYGYHHSSTMEICKWPTKPLTLVQVTVEEISMMATPERAYFDAPSVHDAVRKERESCASRAMALIDPALETADGEPLGEYLRAEIMRSNVEVRGGGAPTSEETTTASPPSP